MAHYANEIKPTTETRSHYITLEEASDFRDGGLFVSYEKARPDEQARARAIVAASAVELKLPPKEVEEYLPRAHMRVAGGEWLINVEYPPDDRRSSHTQQHALTDGLALLLDPNGPEKQNARRQAAAVAEFEARQKRNRPDRAQVLWAVLSPETQAVYRLASTLDGKDRDLMLALARALHIDRQDGTTTAPQFVRELPEFK